MLAGYWWARHASPASADEGGPNFRHGFYLALAGHLFLFAFATHAQWSLPPWPLFGALSVMTLALLAVALAFRDPPAPHRDARGCADGARRLCWGVASSAPWPSVAVGAFAAVSGLSLAWIFVARRAGFEFEAAAVAAVTIVGVARLSPTPTRAHCRCGWSCPGTRPRPACYCGSRPAINGASRTRCGRALRVRRALRSLRHHAAADWSALLVLVSVLNAVFAAYPMLLGGRGRDTRDPYIAAILASVWAFFAARHAFELGDVMHVVGIVPVTLGAVMALHVRELLRIQPPAQRDLGRLALVAAAVTRVRDHCDPAAAR